MNDGWIKTHRRIMQHWIWQDPLLFQRWMYILLMANYTNKKALFKGDLVEYKRGELATSIVKLSNEWNCDRKTVKKFLNMLEIDEMISVKSSKLGTTIKVLNYNAYQPVLDDLIPNEIPKSIPNSMDNGIPNSMDNSLPTTKKVKKEKKDKEGKNKESSRFTPPSLDQVREYCLERNNSVDAEQFIDFYSSKGWMVGKNKMKDWQAAVRNWERRQGTADNSNVSSDSKKQKSLSGYPLHRYNDEDLKF